MVRPFFERDQFKEINQFSKPGSVAGRTVFKYPAFSNTRALCAISLMLRKLLVIIIVDILILGPSMYCGDLDPSIAIGLLIYIPVIIVINLAVWFILFSRQSSWAKSVLINSLICPFILSYFFHAGIAKHDADNYKSLYFSQNKGNYKLTLQLEKGRLKDTLEFEFYELGNGSSSTIDLDGKYTSKGDTVFLTTKKGKEMKVFQMVLFDYPMSGDKIKLNAPRD